MEAVKKAESAQLNSAQLTLEQIDPQKVQLLLNMVEQKQAELSEERQSFIDNALNQIGNGAHAILNGVKGIVDGVFGIAGGIVDFLTLGRANKK